jgi:hypothetical protein
MLRALERSPIRGPVLEQSGCFIGDLVCHPRHRLKALDKGLVVRTTSTFPPDEHPSLSVGPAAGEMAVVVETPSNPQEQ